MRRTAGILLFAGLPLAALAYNLDGNRWVNGIATFHVAIPGIAPSGISWNEGFEDALAQWSDQTAFTFLVDNNVVDPCAGFSANDTGDDFPDGDGDGLNSAGFGDDVCGNDFGDSVLAITLTLAAPGNLGFAFIDQADILFNNAFDWDIYTGDRKQIVDFRRVALHELGHAMGLGHESSNLAIMAPAITNLDTLQADDIEGANALYDGPGDCEIQDISLNMVLDNALQDGDCAVLELYGGGEDTSFVDTYRLNLAAETSVSIMMESAVLDSVLLVTDNKLNGLDFDDDSAGNCNSLINATFPAGEYLILANTYVEPFKCPGNTGSYKLSISDNILPMLANARTVSGISSHAIFHGGATADGGATYKSSFLASEVINASASVQPDPAHVGEGATFYVVAILSTGHTFARLPGGKYQKITSLKSLPAYRHTSSLQALESFSLLNGISGDSLGVNGIGASFFIGYSLDANPTDVHFNGKPVSFSIQ